MSDFETRAAFRTTLMAVQFSSFLLPIVIGLVTPGRKGKMRTEKTAFHPRGSLSGAAELYAQRLVTRGFKITSGAEPGLITAKRKSGKDQDGPLGVHTHAGKPLQAEIRLDQQPEGVAATVAVWTPDLVLKDTGEGRYIDGVLDDLLGIQDEGGREPVRNHSFNSTAALYNAVLIWIGAFLLAGMAHTPARASGIADGLYWSTGICVLIAGLGIRAAAIKPREVSGKDTAIAAIILALTASGFVAYALTQRQG